RRCPTETWCFTSVVALPFRWIFYPKKLHLRCHTQSARMSTAQRLCYGLFQTMKAVVLEQQGSVEQLKYVPDFPDPAVREDHVVIRVRAASFNYHDVFTVRGMPGIKVPLPMIIGLDMAGEILETGPGVDRWKIGDRVLVNPINRERGLMGEMMHGGLAEKCLVAQHQLIRMPDPVTYADAAALPVAYGTAHRMLITHKTVKAGDKVLVL